MLATFTETLTDLGFRSAGISAEGLRHRWSRGDASLDRLLEVPDAENSLDRLATAGES